MEPKKNLSIFAMKEPWKVPYLRRKRISGQCALFDDINGCYPNEDDWEAVSILNLKASVDSDGRVSEINYYKVQDLSSGHGRPQTRDLDLNASDIKKFRSILEAATISRADGVIEQLLQKAQDEGLPGGWNLLKWNKTNASFITPSGNPVSVPIKRILHALEISYSFLDILDSAEFWDANNKTLNPADRDALLTLFSLVDTSNYYDREALISEASARSNQFKEEYETALGFQLLYDACERGDVKSVKKYASFAAERVGDNGISPLCLAIQNDNLTIVNTLLNNGASINDQFWNSGTYATPLSEAVARENDAIVFRCLKQEFKPSVQNEALRAAVEHKRADYVVAMLKKGAILDAGKYQLDFSSEELAQLAKFPGIKWLPRQLETVYKAGDIRTVKNMLKSLAAFSDLNSHSSRGYIDEPLPYQQLAIEWIVKKKDLNLMRYCAGLQYEVASDYVDIWSRLLALPTSWAKYVRGVFADQDYYECNVQLALDRAAEELCVADCKKLISGYGAKVDSGVVYKVCSSAGDGNPGSYESMLMFIIDQYDFPRDQYQTSAQQKQQEVHSPYERRNHQFYDFEFLFEGVVESCSRKLCLRLFDRYPEIFDIPELQSSLMFYCYRRTVDDDIRQIAEDRICPQLYHRAQSLFDTSEPTCQLSEQLKSITAILIRAGKADTEEFASFLNHLRVFEDDKKTWALYAEAISSGLDDSDDPIPVECLKFENKRLISELEHIYLNALELSGEKEDFLIRFEAKQLVEVFDSIHLPVFSGFSKTNNS